MGTRPPTRKAMRVRRVASPRDTGKLLEPHKVAGRSRFWLLLLGVMPPLLATLLLQTGAKQLDGDRNLDGIARLVIPALTSVLAGLNVAFLTRMIRNRRRAEKKAIEEQVRPLVRRAVQSVSEDEALHCKV